MTSVATLIGDVVGSRSAADRRGLHARLEEVIATINATTDPVHPVRILSLIHISEPTRPY